MSADPSLSAVTLPPGAAAKIDGSDEDHAASFVTFTEAPFFIVAIAVNCAVSPTTIRLFVAPRIFNDAAALAAVDEADGAVGADDDEPHAAIRPVVRTAALAVRHFMP